VASPVGRRDGFGKLVAGAPSNGELLRLESEHGRAEGLHDLDRLVGGLAIRLLDGEMPFSLDGGDPDPRRMATLRLSGLSEEQERLVTETFSLEHQQARGTWSLSEKSSAKLGLLHFPAHLRTADRFFHDAVEGPPYASVATASSPEAVLAQTIIVPLFVSFYEPFALRSGRTMPANRQDSREKSREQRKRRWRAAETFLADIGLDVDDELSVLVPGGGWTRLRAAEQLSAKVALGEALRREAAKAGPTAMGARYRAVRLRPMLKRYYSRADKEGRVLRRRALTRELEGTLAGFFGGDWLAFLDYVGEEPHPEEHVATALPESRLYLGLSQKASGSPGLEGVSEEQLELIAASLYGGASSPAQERVGVVKRYWEAFDAAHARQRSGMPSLWGLVEEWRGYSLTGRDPDGPYSDGIYRRLLPSDLLGEVERLWGTTTLPREPDRIVTEPFPHVAMADAFGPALRFWQGCALTAWFLCEGPYSRTDMEGLEHYHRRELARLEELGVPVDRGMFADLVAAEKRLGPPEPSHVETREIAVEPGITITSTMSRGSRRRGFEALRDVVTEHRRRWAERHLDAYLRTRAERDVRGAAEQYHKETAKRGGKPPTPKQFAKFAREPANRWFGGDVAALYRAFGERSPVSPERIRRLPADTEAFVRRVYVGLGGIEVGPYPDDYTKSQEYGQKVRENESKARLANMALDYLQLEEALGAAPTLQRFGKGGFAGKAEAVFDTDVDDAWDRFERIVQDSLDDELNDSSATASFMTGIDPEGLEERQPVEVPSSRDSAADHGESERSTEIVEPAKPGASDRDRSPDNDEPVRRKSWWRRLLGN
jgi:hypothetical protein